MQLSDLTSLRSALPAVFAPVAQEAVIGLAVSGGPDSLALMLLAREWTHGLEFRPQLIVYTVDHGLRPEAAAEALFVLATAKRLGLEARVLHWDGDKPRTGIQAAARRARYRLIGDAMRADGATVLLTAHHRDDQAETVLMRMAHGSGLEGLRGMETMADVEGVRVCRPLLEVGRDVLGEVAAVAGLRPVADPSNGDRHYERVRWRQIMPQLSALGLDATQLSLLARRAGETDAAIGQWAEASFTDLVVVDALGAARLPADAFKGLPRAVGVKLLARVLNVAGGGQRPRALGVVERVYEAIVAPAAFEAVTVLGTAIRPSGDNLWFCRELGRRPPAPVTIGPEQKLVWDRRFTIVNRSERTAIGVAMAGPISRLAAEELVGQKLRSPIEAIRSAPLVRAEGGTVLAIGAYRLAKEVAVTLS